MGNVSNPEPARVVQCGGRLMYRSNRKLSGFFTSIGQSSSNNAEGHWARTALWIAAT